VFERFSEEARQVVVYAQDEARELRHNYIGTEHVLLGLLREGEGIPARSLGNLGVTLVDMRTEVANIVGQGDEIITGQIPFTPRAKRILEFGLREALSMGHNYIGPEHLLLGLARENEGVAARILFDRGLTARAVASAVIEQAGRTSASAASFSESEPPGRSDDTGAYSGKFWRSFPFALRAGVFAIALGLGILIGWLIWG
jgi:ATP-dependent Clp protease ATP-binding subunit ClpC